jgi:hypothetical protein
MASVMTFRPSLEGRCPISVPMTRTRRHPAPSFSDPLAPATTPSSPTFSTVGGSAGPSLEKTTPSFASSVMSTRTSTVSVPTAAISARSSSLTALMALVPASTHHTQHAVSSHSDGSNGSSSAVASEVVSRTLTVRTCSPLVS